MEQKKKSPSWVAIVLWFIFFWPVGVYLIWKKLSSDKAAAMKNSKVLRVIGIVFIFFGVVMLSEIGNDAGTALFGFLFYAGGGALIIWESIKVKQSGERYKKYIDIVINQEQRTIENIASQMGLSYDQTVKGLQKMIDVGYFSGAYIDQANHEIVFPRRQQQVAENTYVQQSSSAPSQPQQKAVKCPNCGGNNIITIGRICECDFCGSPIE